MPVFFRGSLSASAKFKILCNIGRLQANRILHGPIMQALC
jgi:hypothetical protein